MFLARARAGDSSNLLTAPATVRTCLHALSTCCVLPATSTHCNSAEVTVITYYYKVRGYCYYILLQVQRLLLLHIITSSEVTVITYYYKFRGYCYYILLQVQRLLLLRIITRSEVTVITYYYKVRGYCYYVLLQVERLLLCIIASYDKASLISSKLF